MRRQMWMPDLWLVVGILLCIGGPSRAQTDKSTDKVPGGSPASHTPLTKTRLWLVDNKNGLVTVREKDGPTLFSQTIKTTTLIVEATHDGETSARTMQIKDGAGKPLYKMAFPNTVSKLDFHTEFFHDVKTKGTDVKTGGVSFSLTPFTKDEAPDDYLKEDGRLHFVLNRDNWPDSGEAVSGDERVVFKRTKTQLLMARFEADEQTEKHTITFDPKKNGAILYDGKPIDFGHVKAKQPNLPIR